MLLKQWSQGKHEKVVGATVTGQCLLTSPWMLKYKICGLACATQKDLRAWWCLLGLAWLCCEDMDCSHVGLRLPTKLWCAFMYVCMVRQSWWKQSQGLVAFFLAFGNWARPGLTPSNSAAKRGTGEKATRSARHVLDLKPMQHQTMDTIAGPDRVKCTYEETSAFV